MDKEFHYYVNYLIAVRAGFALSDAYKIAYAAQYVDDNNDYIDVYDQNYEIIYSGTATQTYNLLLPQRLLRDIYLVYHFIPSNKSAVHSNRRDGRSHKMEVWPDNDNSLKVLRASLESGDIYWIGIASHAFVDAWSHQNFIGTHSCYNAIPGFLKKFIPNIGHADAATNPDHLGLIWKDKRLVNKNIDNNKRFIAASIRLLEEYLKILKASEQLRVKILNDTKKELLECFGFSTRYFLYNLLYYKPKRMRSYGKLAKKYSQLDIPLYAECIWENEALTHHKQYRWKDEKNYSQTDWYFFQNAAKKHYKFLSSRIQSFLDIDR